MDFICTGQNSCPEIVSGWTLSTMSILKGRYWMCSAGTTIHRRLIASNLKLTMVSIMPSMILKLRILSTLMMKKEVIEMPITITVHVFGITITVTVKSTHRHSAK